MIKLRRNKYYIYFLRMMGYFIFINNTLQFYTRESQLLMYNLHVFMIMS